MGGIEAAYALAGMVGVHPRGLTLAELWDMSQGRRKMMREHAYHVAALFGSSGVNVELFLATGSIDDGSSPPYIPPELQRKVDEHQAKCHEAGKFFVAE